MKRLLLILLSIALVATLFAQTGTTQPVRPPGGGTEQNPFMITNLANLRWLSEVSGGTQGWWTNATTTYHFIQVADIDATETATWNNGQGFRPIGHPTTYDYMDGFWFRGVYDGGNFKISNLFMATSSTDAITGFFSSIFESELKNINLENVNFSLTGENSGGLVGMGHTSVINNCKISGNIAYEGDWGVVAGMVATAYITSVSNSHVAANITVDGGWMVAGIVADAQNMNNQNGSITNSSMTGNITVTGEDIVVGGIVGEIVCHGATANLGFIRNCFSTGDIHVTGDYVNVGGIAGIYSQSAEMQNCFSRGNITGIGSYGASVGGIVSDSPNSHIAFAYSSGNIYGSSNSNTNVGGILAERLTGSPRITNSHSTGNITGFASSGSCRVGGITGTYFGTTAANTYEFLYATGVITSSQNNAGGLVGIIANNNSPINNSYFNNETSGVTVPVGAQGANANLNNVHGRTVAQMKTQANYTGTGAWNFTTIWAIDPEINNGFPHLRNLNYNFGGEDDPPNPFNPPINLTAAQTGTDVMLTWFLPSDRNGELRSPSNRNGELRSPHPRVITHFTISRNGDQIADNITQTFYKDTSVSNNTLYTYTVKAVYSNPDGVSDPSEEASIHPLFPARDLTYELNEFDIVLKWLAPTGTGVTGYKVFKGDDLKATVTALTWTDTETEPETEYTYKIVAVYAAGESEAITITIITPEESMNFNPPVLLTATVEDNFVNLTWHLPIPDPEIDDLQLNYFKVYRDGVAIANEVNETIYSDLTAVNVTLYTYYVTAVYTYMEANVESIPSNSEQVTTRFPVRNLTATSIQHDVKLNWVAPVGGTPIYNVYRNNTLLTTPSITEITFTDTNTTPAASYTYQVAAVYSGFESPRVDISIIVPLLNPATNLYATVFENNVELTWGLPVEILPFEVFLGFDIYRDEILINDSPIMELTIEDNGLPEGQYTIIYSVYARYEQGISVPIQFEAIIDYVVPIDDVIDNYITDLSGNYPNPFNPETVIKFSMENTGHVTIDIYNVRGQKIFTLVNSPVEKGEHSVVWKGVDDYGRKVGSGVYFYHMKTADYNAMKRMVLMK